MLETLVLWLDDHDGTVTALATVVLAGVTTAYVLETRRLVAAQRRQATKPVLHWDFADKESPSADLLIKNVGNGTATNIYLVPGPVPNIHPAQLVDQGSGSLTPNESSRWEISDPDLDELLPLTLFWMDQTHEELWYTTFSVRVRPKTRQAGSGGSFDHRGLRKLGEQGLTPWSRLQYRRKAGEDRLFALMFDPRVHSALAKQLLHEQRDARTSDEFDPPRYFDVLS